MRRQKKVPTFSAKHAKTELQELIAQQVNAAIARSLHRPNDGTPVASKNTGNEVLRQVSTLLQAYAPHFEQKAQN